MALDSNLYRTARALRWAKALSKGPEALLRRMVRVALGRLFGRLMRRI
jgi:hypothetical protein